MTGRGRVMGGAWGAGVKGNDAHLFICTPALASAVERALGQKLRLAALLCSGRKSAGSRSACGGKALCHSSLATQRGLEKEKTDKDAQELDTFC